VRALRSSALRETARPELERLASETGEAATLEVLAEGKMLILDEVLGPRLIGASPSLGSAWALHATSTGKAVLAALARGRVTDLLGGGRLKGFTAATITSRRTLDAELDAIRTRGFAIAREELELGYSAVAAVIPIPMETEARAALSVGGPSERLDEDKLEALGRRVREGADEVAAKLGYERPS
jgi:DNA-binding IclR family transcriptional regulator